MGLLRFYLAAAVIAWHAESLGGYHPMPGYMAVQVFYLISGFYMALVLNTKYLGAGSYRVFLANRLLRIFPAYWVTLLATFAFCFLGNYFLGHSRLSPYLHNPLKPGTWAYLVGMNLSLIGQDTTLFLDLLPDGSLAWPADFHARAKPPLHLFMLLPQAWSLSIELMFYAVAPFLVRRRLGVVLALIAASFGVRLLTTQALGLAVDPWEYRFFPSELGIFLAGTVSYHIYRRIKEAGVGRAWLAGVSTAYLAATLAYQPAVSQAPLAWQKAAYWAYFALTTVAVAFLFRWTEKNRRDRYIGELSFPIYILHILVLMFVANLFPHHSEGLSRWAGLTCLVVSTILAAVMMRFFIEPIERFRHHLKPKDLGVEAPAAS